MTLSSESILGLHPQQLIDDGLDMYKYPDMSLSTRYMGRYLNFLMKMTVAAYVQALKGYWQLKIATISLS